MDPNPECPVCGENVWKVIGEFHYSREMNDSGSDYDRSRMQVLFEVWCSGLKEINLSAILCGHCGYATYKPLPTALDVNVKYEFQKKTHPNQGVNLNRDALRLDAKRAKRVFRRLAPFLPSRSLRVLDYGGGDGKLMRPFLKRGHECFVVDYNENPIPEVRHIACTLDGMTPSRSFELIICSHVIEHLAEPAKLLRELVSYLSPNGLMYAEVPDELFNGIPIARDPVTHVGFFCRRSLEVLLQVAGLRILKSRAQVGTYNERPLHVIWSIGQRSSLLPVPGFEAAARSAVAAVRPSFSQRLLRGWNPYYLWGLMRQNFHYHHPARRFFRRWARRVKDKLFVAAVRT